MKRRDTLYKKFKHFGLVNDKNNFKVTKMQLQKMILKKKKSYFEEKLAKKRCKPKKPWKAIKSLGLSSDKANKFFFRKMIQFNLKHRTSKKNCQSDPPNLLAKQPKTTMPRLHATNPVTLNCQM